MFDINVVLPCKQSRKEWNILINIRNGKNKTLEHD